MPPDTAFALAVATGIAVPLFKSRNRRNYFFIALGAVNLEVSCYALVQLAAVLRVFMPLFAPQWSVAAVVAAGVLWAGAFMLLTAGFGPMLVKARIDGRSG